MERETVEFKKDNLVIVCKAWLTGREMNELQGVYLKATKLSVINGQPQIENFDASIETEATKKLIELMVVSVDGKTDGVVDAILDLRSDVYDEVIAFLNTVSKKK